MSNELSYLRADRAGGLDDLTDEQDLLMSVHRAPEGLVNETYLFSFHIPENNLIGCVYLWVHSQLRTSTAFVMIWDGVNRYPHQTAHFNCYQYLPYPGVDGNVITIPEINLEINVVRPHVHHEIRYRHPPSNTSLALTFKALHPPVKEAGKLHLEQAMHVTGEMVLDGASHAVDCYAMRDRSFRGKRSEAIANHPPIAYASCVSSDGSVAFNFCGCDDPDRGAPWADLYDARGSDLFLQGWIQRDGDLRKLVGMSKTSRYDPQDTMRIMAWECDLEDEYGKVHHVSARRLAAVPFAPWASIFNDFLLIEFELDGKITGHGWHNDALWNDYGRTFRET